MYPSIYFKLIKNEFFTFETISDLKMSIRVNSTDLMALTNVWLIQEYSLFDCNIQDDDVILDIGGHIGLFALHVAHFSNKAKVFCYEPMPDNYNLLNSNISMNNLQNIYVHNLAVSSNNDTKKLFVNKDESAHSIIVEGSKSINVNSTTLQEIFDNNNITSCKLLKLDCEGAEYEIIDSLSLDILKKIHNIMIEYHYADSKPHLPKKLISKIQNAGFKIKTKPHNNDMGFLVASK